MLDPAEIRLRDTMLCIKYLPDQHNRDLEGLGNQLRDFEMIRAVAKDHSFPSDSGSLQRYRQRSISLPSYTVRLPPSTSSIKAWTTAKQIYDRKAEAQKELAQTLLSDYQVHVGAVDELTKLSNSNLQTVAAVPRDAFVIPPGQSALEISKAQAEFMKNLATLNLKQIDMSLQRSDKDSTLVDPLHVQDITGTSSALAFVDKILTPSNMKILPTNRKFTPLKQPLFTLNPSTLQTLSESTQSLLSNKKLSISNQSLDKLVGVLNSSLLQMSKQLDSLFKVPDTVSFTRIGDALVKTRQSNSSIWTKIRDGDFGGIDWIFNPPLVPKTHGQVAPVGVADLLVVRQQLMRYEASDVSHIENILKGESRQTDFVSKRTTTTTTSTEEETTTTDERALESTTRYEMSQETDKVIKEDESLKAGASVSGSYGPFVQFSASVEGSTSRSKEEASKTASQYSKDVTERAVNNITKRVLTKTSLTTTEEITEREKHDVNNATGSGNIAGVYQWVNKVYQAQMWNYGLRVMYDIMVPEPAALLIETLNNQENAAIELIKPPAWTISSPADITESTYLNFVNTYKASDVEPPPPFYVNQLWSASDGQGNKDPDICYTKAAQIDVPDGYQAVWAAVSLQLNFYHDNSGFDISVGNNNYSYGPGNDGVWTTALDNLVGQVGITFCTLYIQLYSLTVQVYCQRTDDGLKAWQLKTYSKLLAAQQAQQTDYEDKLSKIQLDAGITIQGTNPTANLVTINTELKRACISIITEQYFDMFDSIVTISGSPEINFNTAKDQGAYARFFEQAFEWEQMTWIAYPYYWSRKSTWADRLGYKDPDPAFNQFMQAGYVRVQIPARPGFELAIQHFMETGDIWEGKGLPSIGDPLYLPIADEIAERLGKPDTEVKQGDPWEVRVPTTLVHLRPDDKLPKWKEDSNGDWVEDNS